jgi:hypothetical protein
MTYTFDGLTLLHRNTDFLGARRKCHIVSRILSKKLHELLGILRDDLRKLWVASCYLLEDGLKHLRLLLNNVSQLLELGIVA